MSQPSLGSQARFSASDAAFAGFAILRKRPTTLLVWAGLLLAFGVVTNVGMLLLIGPQMQSLRTIGATGGTTPADSQAILSNLGGVLGAVIPFYAVVFIASLLMIGVISAAINRAVLRPTEGGPGYLALGVDELLQIAVIFIWGLLLLALYIVLLVGIVLVVGLSAAAIGAAGGGRGGGLAAGAFGILGVLGGFVALTCAVIWLNVRLSLALPLTFDTRRLHVFRSFSLTKGRFWPLFGAYLVAWIIAILISFVFLTVMASLGMALGGGLAGLMSAMRPNTASLAGYFTPVAVISLVLGPFVQAVQWALISGAPASAYAQLKGDPLAEVF